MARPRKPLDESNLLQFDGFTVQVGRALEQMDDAAALGATSPLASPYLLGPLLDPGATGPAARGRVLQTLLRQAAAALEDDEARRVAAACFTERNPHLTNAGIALRLSMTERHLYRVRHKAIAAIANLLYSRLLSPLRLETPVRATMVGREQAFERAQDTLRAGQSVYLTGASGIGKSVLAAQVAIGWGAAAFWYTVRPGYNDRLEPFLFALAYFLRLHGGHRTWRQLVADRGVVQLAQVLGLLRADLAGLPSGALLLCVDDVDLLQEERTEHAQVLHLIDELRPLAALLLTGQRTVIESDALITLAPLTDVELDAWKTQVGAELSLSRNELRTLTRGVPVRLATLRLVADSDPAALGPLLAAGELVSVESLFHRVWRKLTPDERTLLELLAVFESAAPADILPGPGARNPHAPLAELETRGIVVEAGPGLVQLPLFLQSHVSAQIAADRRELLHQRAALYLEERGRFTDAIAHWLAGNQPAAALWLWFRRRESEIDRGQASRALALLAAIPNSQLPDPNDREALRLALAELYLHAGRGAEAEALLRAEARQPGPDLSSYLDELRGDTARMLGQVDLALSRYRAALDTLLESQAHREARMRSNVAHLLTTRMPDLKAARREALIARARAESYHGIVEEALGHLDEAHTRYTAAQALAADAPADPALHATICAHLAQLAILRGALDEAQALIARADALHAQRGDTLRPLHARVNLAYALVQAGAADQAFALAHDALCQARPMRHPYLVCGLAAAAAEAALALGRLVEADALATEAIAQEEEWHLHWALAVLARVRSAQAQHVPALALAEQALASAQSIGNPYSEAYCLHALGDVLRGAGRDGDAHIHYAQAHAAYAAMGLEREADALRTRLNT